MIVQAPYSIVNIWRFVGAVVRHVGNEAAKRVGRGSIHVQFGASGVVPRHKSYEVVVGGWQVCLSDGGRRDMLCFQLLARITFGKVGDIEQALDSATLSRGVSRGQDGDVCVDVG